MDGTPSRVGVGWARLGQRAHHDERRPPTQSLGLLWEVGCEAHPCTFGRRTAAHDCLCGRAPRAGGTVRTPGDAGFVGPRVFDGVRRVRQGTRARPGTRCGASGCGRPAASCERAQRGHHRRLPLSRAMNTSGCLAHRLRTLVTLCGLGLGPSVLSAQKALVYCPVGIDPTGCTTLVQSLGDSGGPFAQRVDMGYDGTDRTIDLASADLSPYAVFIVPALADNADTKPYDRLRTATVASRLRNVLLGRIAVWSGTPDQGTVSRREKNTLVRNLAVWGAANYATSGLRGLVVLQDYSDSLAERYGWVVEISRLAVAADSAPGIYNEVQALTATATQLLNNGGQQLAYTDMASFGIEPPGDSSSATADARGGTSGSQVVLVSSVGHGNGAATVKTNQADYAPGQVVTITGSGWQFGEVVSLVLHEDPAIDTHPTLTATADASGHIFNNQFAPDAHDVGVRFYMTATGQTSGSVALATFTDDNFSVGAVSPASGPTLGGTPVTITGTSFTNGRQPFTVSFGTGAPVSAIRADNQTLTATTPTHTAGTVDVIVTGNAGQGNATSATLTNGFTFTRLDQAAVTISAPGNATFGTPGGTATASGGSGTGAYGFSAGASTACSIDANTGVITVTSGTGTCSLTATRAGDANYNASAASVPATVTIHRAASMTVVSCPGAAHTYTGAPIEPCTAAATGPGGLNVAVTPVTYTSNTNVGTASASATYGGDANHLGSTGTGSFSIGQAASTTTVSCPVGPYTYDGTAHTPCSATVTGAGGLSLAPTPSYSGNTNAATATASYTFSGDANHTGSSDSKTLTIGQASSTTVVSFEAGPYTYRGSAFTATVAVTGAGGLSLTPAPSYSGDCTNVTGPNGCTASYTWTPDANHTGSSDSKSITLTQATSTTTVSCPAGPYTYTGSAQTPCSATVTGASLSLTPTPGYTNNTDARTASASYTFGGDANHTGSSDSKTFTIAKAGSTTTVTAGSFIYDGSPHAATAVVNGVGTGITQTVAFSYSGSCTTAPTTVPQGASCTARADYAGDTTHAPSYGTDAVIITKAPTTTAITVGGATYDGNPHGGTAVVNGVGLSNQPVTVNYAGIPPTSYGPSTTVPTDAGAYRLRATYAGDDNHLGSQDAQTLTIDKAASTTVVSFEAGPYTYRGSAFTATVAVTGAGGLSLTPAPSYSGDCTNVTGPNGCTASYTWTPDANHTGSSDSKSITLTQATSTTTVSCPAGPYTYTGSAQTPCSATVTGASLSRTPTPGYTNNTDAGTASASYTFGGDANHTGSSDSKTFTIAKAGSTTTVTAGSFIYDGSPHAATAVVNGVGTGITQTVAFSYSGSCTTAPTTVPQRASCTARAAYAADTNHPPSYATAPVIITKAPTTTAITVGGATYDGNPHGGTAVVNGVGLSNQPVTVNYAGIPPTGYGPSTTAPTDAGAYRLRATYAGDDNHLGSQDAQTLTIDNATSTTVVSFEAGPYTYRGSAFTATVDVTGAGCLSLTPAPSYSGDCTNVTGPNGCTASYTWTPDANHTGSSDSKSITLTRATSTTTVSCPAGPYTYTGSAQTPCSATVTGASLSLTPTPGYTNNTDAGTASASYTFGGDANHTGSSDSKTFTIAKAGSTTTVTAGSFIYDGSPHAATAVVNGVGTGITQTVAFSYSGSCTTAPTTVPQRASCTARAAYAADTNHPPSYATAPVIITKAPTTTAITVGGATYDGNPHGGTAVVNGVGLSNQPVTVNYAGIPPTSYGPSTTAPTDAGAYRLRATHAGDDNHLGSQDAQTLTIDKAASTTVVSFEAGPYTYRGSAFTATVDVTGAGCLSLTPAPSYSGDCTNVTGPNGCTASYAWTPDANHTGSSDSKSITLTRATSTTTVSCPAGPYTYTGSAQTPCSATVTGASLSLTPTPGYTNN